MKDRFELISFGEGCISEDPEVKILHDQFIKKLKIRSKNNIWIDKVENRVFSLDLSYKNAKDYKETLFLTSEVDFLQDNRHGLPFFESKIGSHYQLGDLIADNNFIIEKSDIYETIKGKTIFIIGAGPSSNLINLSDVDTDQVWICNDFLNNDKTKDLDVSLFYMSNLSYSRKREFEYFKEKDVTVCFDVNVSRDYNVVSKYKKLKKDKCFVFSTRMFTTIGTIPRLMFLAAVMGASEIKVIGLDGHTEQSFQAGESLSSFEKNKKKIPNGQTFGAQCREYLLFWEFMKLKFPKLKIDNLSVVSKDNVSGKFEEILR